AGLAGNAAAFNHASDIVLAGGVGAGQRFDGVHALIRDCNVLVNFLAVDGHLAAAGHKLHSGDAGLASASALEFGSLSLCHDYTARASGFWATCGWAAPRYTFNLVIIARPSRFFGIMPW